eukprot:3703427-Pyramimonas_sp.AAC.1
MQPPQHTALRLRHITHANAACPARHCSTHAPGDPLTGSGSRRGTSTPVLSSPAMLTTPAGPPTPSGSTVLARAGS